MFKNVGGKIKIIAKIFFWISIIAYLVVGIVFLKDGFTLFFQEFKRWIGIGIIIGGFFVSWFSSLFLCGLGEIIESCEETRSNTYKAARIAEENQKLLKDVLESGSHRNHSSQSASKNNDELPPM